MNKKLMLITGSKGFIGKNLVVHLSEISEIGVLTFDRGDHISLLPDLVSKADAIIHLAGVNRPSDPAAFSEINANLTSSICDAIENEVATSGREIPIVLASSTQAEMNNPYGRSKLAAEESLQNLARNTANPCVVFRLPGVFGKWCKPNYNSVVATFCHKISRNQSVHINDPSTVVRLVYVDDVIRSILDALKDITPGFTRGLVQPEYQVTLDRLAAQIKAFADCRTSLLSERVGEGLTRALYATYVSYLPDHKFSYPLQKHGDSRGVFVEMLKTKDSGQFSYFTAHPGVTRGGHYHHTKTEKFLVVKGEALFRFRHMITGEFVEFYTSAGSPEVVDTIPGWAHDITNVGQEDMVVMLWANENFDPKIPDTVACEL